MPHSFFGGLVAIAAYLVAGAILGHGGAKGELSKHIIAKKIRGLTVEPETADKMTERQVAAQVSEHFKKAPARKLVASKKTAKAMSRKRT